MRAPAKVISSCATATPHDVARRAAGLGHQPGDLEGHEAAQAVVHGARHDAAVRELDGLAGDHGDVADAHQAARVLAVLRADVDVEVAQLRDLLALLVAQQVDRLLAHHAGDHAAARGDLHALADEDHRVPAADAGEPQEAVVVDVVDDQADLVDVADDGEQRPVGGALHARDGRADGVVGDLGEGGGRLAEHGGGALLVARGAGSGEELAQDVGDGHGGGQVSGLSGRFRRRAPAAAAARTGRIPPCLK